MTETEPMQSMEDRPRPRLLGCWDFDEGSGTVAHDSSGHGHDLAAASALDWLPPSSISGAIALNGRSQWLETPSAVIATTESYSVTAWVRLDRGTLGDRVTLPDGEFAFTAVSQSGATHSPFYLGVRLTPPPGEPHGELSPRWCFTTAPIDGSQTGTIDWEHAASPTVLGERALDRWTLLVGVCDVLTRTSHLYVPDSGEHTAVRLPEVWTYWAAESGFQVGQGRYLGEEADLWPGSVGPVRAFAGALTTEDALNLFRRNAISLE